MDKTILGERVHILRRRLDMTQSELGEAVGVAGISISRLETGRFQDVRAGTLYRLADVLGVSTDYLLGRDMACHSDK